MNLIQARVISGGCPSIAGEGIIAGLTRSEVKIPLHKGRPHLLDLR